MTQLKCEVENCHYNCDHLCGLNEIEVSGSYANTSDATCCSSFRESNGQSNAIHDAVPDTYINCSAENCQHNEECKCHADGVEVCGCGAQKRENTACNTFISR